MTEIPKPGATERVTSSADSRFIFSGLPWLPILRPSLPAPETVQPETEQPGTDQATLEDTEQFKRDLLAAQLVGDMGSIVSLPPEALVKIFPVTDSQKPAQTETPNQIKPKHELFRRIFGYRIF